MDLFAQAETVDDILAAFDSEPAFQPFRKLVTTWDRDMLGVAIAVTRKWAHPSSSRGEGL
jgi:hypothetical protein